jgi:hypothetical protein
MEISDDAKERLRRSIEGTGFSLLDEKDLDFNKRKEQIEILLYQKGEGWLD